MAKIGFIGLGHMGFPMVQNLLKKNQVKVFDVQTDKIQSLVQQGAIAAENPGDAAKDVDFVFTMLQTGDQVLKVWRGERGILKNISTDSIYIDSSSIAIGTTQELHKEAKKQGIAMLDAPVSGGVKGAEAATLTIMVGGGEKDFLRAKAILAQLGKNIIHAGPEGRGQAAKICNNMILGISMIAVSEGFALAEKLGLDAKKFFEICSQSSGQCWSLTSYCPMPGVLENVPSSHEYQPGFMASMMLKDLLLSQDAAQSAQVETLLGEEATEIYEDFCQQGFGNLDFSAIIKSIRQNDEDVN